MQLNEMHALKIPVSPFNLTAQGRAIGEAGVQQRDDRLGIVFGNPDAGGEGPSACGCGLCHNRPPEVGRLLCMGCSASGKVAIQTCARTPKTQSSPRRLWKLCAGKTLVANEGAGLSYVRVEFVDKLVVLLFGDPALELHGEGQGATIKSEVVGKQNKPFDGFVLGQVSREAADLALNDGVGAGMSG